MKRAKKSSKLEENGKDEAGAGMGMPVGFVDDVDKWKGDAVLVLMHEEDCKKCDVASGWSSYVRALVKRKDFEGKKGSLTKAPLFDGDVGSLYVAGLGKVDDFTPARLRDALAAALRRIGRERNGSVLILSEKTEPEANVILGEAVELCGYVFDKYKEKKAEDAFALREIFISKPASSKETMSQIEVGRIFASAQKTARDLANEPGNVVNPLTLADRAEAFARDHGLSCEVWDEKRLEAERMGALLAVGQGSNTPPRLIHLTYKPRGEAKKKVVFVGKGITFDSGGLDLKPSDFMKTMKGDKTGACNVIGIMQGVAALTPDVEVHGIIAAAENMPSGTALRPDDIVRARNGKTIEIDNTDAEGRLVLADALSVASELKPDVIVDMATLTGACAVALGSWTAGLFTRDDALCDALCDAGKRRGERLWRLPMDDEKIGETLKSKFADLVNGAGRYGGATFAAMFLSEFVEKNIAWAHLDIAGVDFYREEWGVCSAGASAWGVRTCLDFVIGAERTRQKKRKRKKEE
ncbi:MAG: leucyl aminopeptidase [Synergistaceae bacterium]|jgi:leucyl aminopeptidase|nr:leucyl aminopeptidase [Synergistaceae bacterium]